MSDDETQSPDLNEALLSSASNYRIELSPEQLQLLLRYFSLVNRWNQRLHLVAPCSPQEFATRHILESLLMIHHLPPDAKIADVGSGAGLPIIPCLIVRSDITATLIESSKKKTVFLREALRETNTSRRATILDERFEHLPTPACGYVSCRALDHFEDLLPKLISWSPRPVTLLLFGGENLESALKGQQLVFSRELIPNSERRFLFEVKLE